MITEEKRSMKDFTAFHRLKPKKPPKGGGPSDDEIQRAYYFRFPDPPTPPPTIPKHDIDKAYAFKFLR
jgi:hypothetical protein